jgi:hypothetical protein
MGTGPGRSTGSLDGSDTVALETSALLSVCVLAYAAYGVATIAAYGGRGKGGVAADPVDFITGYWVLYPFRHHEPMSAYQRHILWCARISLVVALATLGALFYVNDHAAI